MHLFLYGLAVKLLNLIFSFFNTNDVCKSSTLLCFVSFFMHHVIIIKTQVILSFIKQLPSVTYICTCILDSFQLSQMKFKDKTNHLILFTIKRRKISFIQKLPLWDKLESRYSNFFPKNSQITKCHSRYYFSRYSRNCTCTGTYSWTWYRYRFTYRRNYWCAQRADSAVEMDESTFVTFEATTLIIRLQQ